VTVDEGIVYLAMRKVLGIDLEAALLVKIAVELVPPVANRSLMTSDTGRLSIRVAMFRMEIDSLS
jgi:hypothetical protein